MVVVKYCVGEYWHYKRRLWDLVSGASIKEERLTVVVSGWWKLRMIESITRSCKCLVDGVAIFSVDGRGIRWS